MRFKFPKKSIARALLLCSLISISGCATPIPDACAWLTDISPNPGYKTRWTPDEQRQVDALDKNIDKNCGR